MARTCGAGYLKLNTPPALVDFGMTGSVCITAKPSWTNDASSHTFWHWEKAGNPLLLFVKGPDGILTVGWFTNIEHRISLPAAGLFTAGETARWVFTWDIPVAKLWKDGVVIATLTQWFTPTITFRTIGVGNYVGAAAGFGPANADLSEFACFHHALTPAQVATYQTRRADCITPAPFLYNRILGDASPEPSEIGPEMVLFGTPAQATHPTVLECRLVDRNGDANALLAA